MRADGWQGHALGTTVLAWIALAWIVLAGISEAQDAVTDEQAAPGRLHVAIDRGAVTLRARDVALKDVLAALAPAGGLEVDHRGRLDEKVTLELDSAPMLEALRQVLSGRNFALRYFDPSSGPAAEGEDRAGKLWIFAGGEDLSVKGKGRRSRADAEMRAAYERLARRRPGLASDDGKVRLAAVSELAESGEAAEALAAAALFDGDAAVREEAVYGLGVAGGETGLRILEQALADPALRVREAAVEAIADVGGDESAWALSAALQDEDASLREQAVYALGDIGGEAAVPVLKQALADGRGFVRKAATEVLDELAGEE